jgi:copper oxidase (laccase) domain-containing protein
VDGYEVGFTTRVGGVSEGPYASLNLGRKSGDEVERVDENRRIVCDAIGADLEKLALNYQVHSARVLHAAPAMRGEHADGLWTDEPGLPILAMSADCLPIVLARDRRERARRRVLHAGWRGLLEGIAAAGAQALAAVR